MTPAQRRADALRRLVAVNDSLRVAATWLRRGGYRWDTETETPQAGMLRAMAGNRRAPKRELSADEWRELRDRFAGDAGRLRVLAGQCDLNADAAETS